MSPQWWGSATAPLELRGSVTTEGVVPVIDLGPAAELQPSSSGEPPAAAVASEVNVLIVQTPRGVWGIRVDRGCTRISAERPSPHEPVRKEEGVVAIGMIRHGAAEHTLLDVEATWESLRGDVTSRYGRIGKLDTSEYR